MCNRLVVVVAVGAIACGGGDREDSGLLLEADPIPYEVEDEGLGVTATSATCDAFNTELLVNQPSLDLLYDVELGITPAPQLDFDTRAAVLAWVPGCYGDDAKIEITSVTSSGPDELVAAFALSGTVDIGAERKHPYVLLSVERAGYASLQASITVP